MDFYKGLLMWGVIWGHTITALLNGSTNDIGIHPIFRTYDMPFFMAISGYFFSFSFRKYRIDKLILNKITTLVFPTLLWTLILYQGRNLFGSFYFIWAVFWSSIIIGVVNTLIHNRTIQIVFFILLTIGFHFLPVSSHIIYNLPFLFPFFVVGYYAMPLIEQMRKKFALFIIPLFVCILCFWSTSYSIWNAGANLMEGSQVLLSVTMRAIVGMTGIMGMSIVFDMFHMYLSDSFPRFLRVLEGVGQQTLGLFILQEFVVFRILAHAVQIMERHAGYNLFDINHLLTGYIIAPLLSLAISVALYLIIHWCRNKRFLKYLFGFKF